VVRRVRSTVEGADRHTPAFQLSDQDDITILISSERVSNLIRLNCEINGVTKGYGCAPKDLGTRSIRSGAAMGLFLMDHSVEKIMILGRWSSDTFMVYIRPQVLEWTNIMSRDLALAGNYRDLGYQGKVGAIRPDKSILGRGGLIPRFYLGRSAGNMASRTDGQGNPASWPTETRGEISHSSQKRTTPVLDLPVWTPRHQQAQGQATGAHTDH
jgi:hypothetical protein